MLRSTATHEGSRAHWRLLLALVASAVQGGEEDKWKQAISVAQHLQENHQLAEARTVLFAVIADAEAHSDREYRLAYTFDNLGSIAQDQGRYFEAEDHYRRSIRHWQRAGQQSDAGLSRTLNNLSSLLYSAGKFRESAELLERAIAGQPAHDDGLAATMLLNCGDLHLSQREFQRAEQCYGRAWSILEQQKSSRELEFARLAHRFGVLYEATGRMKQAELHFLVAEDGWERILKRDTAVVEAVASLAALYWKSGRHVAATQLFQKALMIGEKELGPNDSRMADILLDYASLLLRTGNQTEADKLKKRVEAIRTNSQQSFATHTISFNELIQEKRNK